MKWSNYNITHKSSKGEFIIYNYATNQVLILVPELYELIDNMKNRIEDLALIHPDFYKTLSDKKFIINDNINESSFVKNMIIKNLSIHNIFHLTINPTLDCNLRCWYCYEQHTKNGYMSTETMNAIINFVNRITNDYKLRTLELCFFGGEPLLKAKQIAIPLLKEINNICIKKNKKLNLHFTSNGVLLSKSIVDELSTITQNVRFQIAFDGDENTHNKIKFLHNKKGTYQIVLKNINYAISKGISFNIRCNYNIENIDSFKKLVNDISHLPHLDSELISFSLQKVWQSAYTRELDNKVDILKKVIDDKKLHVNIATKEIADFCYADYKNSIVINYNGDIYKCTARDFNKINSIGEIKNDGSINYNHNREKLYSKLFFFKDCDSCILLPICRICIQARIEHKNKIYCFKNIPEEDKQRQIQRHFKSVCKDYI